MNRDVWFDENGEFDPDPPELDDYDDGWALPAWAVIGFLAGMAGLGILAGYVVYTAVEHVWRLR